MTLKILLLGCLVTVSCVAAQRGGHGGFNGGGYGHGHGFGDHRGPGGHGFGGGGGPGYGPGHWGDGHGHGGGHRGPGWHDHNKEPHQPDSKTTPEPTLQPKNPDHHQPCPTVNFLVHEPQGMEAWIIDEQALSFELEVYINKRPGIAGASCDFCVKTTEVSYGKFLVENKDLLVKRGDTLNYIAWIGDKEHKKRRCDEQSLIVTNSIITECDCETSDIQDIDIRFNGENKRAQREAIFVIKEQSTFQNTDPTSGSSEDMISDTEVNRLGDKDSQRKIEILEDIVEHMKSSCASKVTNQLILLKQAPFAADGDDDLLNFVKTYFGISAEMQSLADDILRVIPAHPGIGQGVLFEMESYADKQRVLYYDRINDLRQIVDYDHSENSY